MRKPSASGRSSFLFDRWPRFAHRRPWLVIVSALVIVCSLAVAFAFAGGAYGDVFNLRGAESQRLIDLLKERFPERAGDSATVVVSTSDGADDPDVLTRVDALVADLKRLPDVVNVTSPYDVPGAISADGSIARISVQYAQPATEVNEPAVKELLDYRETVSSPEFTVEVGGPVLRRVEQEAPGNAEIIAFTAAVVILLVAFGSIVAMGVPLLTAAIGLSSGFFLIGVGASFFAMPSFTPQFGAMIGTGVGIDYALLVLNRFREARARGLPHQEATVEAASTAGRSVVFAGSTVVIALLGLWAAGISAIGYVGTAASLVVALAVAVAVIVLPAILRIAGPYIERWRIPLLAAPAQESETGMGYRLSRFVQRRPVLCLTASLAVLLTLAAPTLGLQLGTSDAGSNPNSFTSRRAYDLLSRGFGPGSNGPILIGFQLDSDTDARQMEQLLPSLAETKGVAAVSSPALNQDRSAAIVTVIPETPPQAQETVTLVHDLRTLVRGSSNGDGQALVGGATALGIDVGDRISSRLPLFFAGVIGLSFLLLMALFRSVFVALKAAVMNLLSIGAAFGLLVAVFQWGWLGGVFGVQREGPIEFFLPMMLFAVLFGLSMDYEVFLVSRIREEYLMTGDNTESVARGLSVTTRVISAAAAIMVAVFMSFAVSHHRVVKEFGVGLATAVFLDATIVRLVLVPSLMQVMGSANWWFPGWLDRIVPRIGIEPTKSRSPREAVPEPMAVPTK